MHCTYQSPSKLRFPINKLNVLRRHTLIEQSRSHAPRVTTITCGRSFCLARKGALHPLVHYPLSPRDLMKVTNYADQTTIENYQQKAPIQAALFSSSAG